MIGTLLIVFFLLLIFGLPVGFAMGISAACALLTEPTLPGLVMAQKMNTSMDSFSMMAIPFFMLAGQIMESTGITKSIVKFANAVVGHIRGGIAHTAVVTGMLMAGISGSANADASAIGSIMVPTLKDAGYKDGFAVSVVSAASILGPIIPPSIFMIMYASITSISIGSLFLAGILPGILMGGGFMVCSYFYARRNGIVKGKFLGFKEIWVTFKEAVWALLMPAIIIGGILSGIFTATEAGVVAVIYGLVYGLIKKRLKLKGMEKCLKDAVMATAAPMFVISVASIFAYILTRESLPVLIVTFISSITTNPYFVVLIIMIIIVFMGMFVDPTAGMMMLVPVLIPVVQAFGFQPIHFAMILILTLLTGGLTPPVGLVLYIVASVDRTPLSVCVKPVWPFVVIMLMVIVAIVFIPQIVTIIPSLLG